MDPYGSWWILMTPGGSSWLLMAPHGSSWLLMDPMDPHRSLWILWILTFMRIHEDPPGSAFSPLGYVFEKIQ
ncbi:unnamed protein product, partial [Adineta steineri]